MSTPSTREVSKSLTVKTLKSPNRSEIKRVKAAVADGLARPTTAVVRLHPPALIAMSVLPVHLPHATVNVIVTVIDDVVAMTTGPRVPLHHALIGTAEGAEAEALTATMEGDVADRGHHIAETTGVPGVPVLMTMTCLSRDEIQGMCQTCKFSSWTM